MNATNNGAAAMKTETRKQKDVSAKIVAIRVANGANEEVMSAHTPGPWMVHLTDAGVNAIDQAPREGGTSTRVAFFRPTYRPTHEDARLIAAAPDGLAAADEALACLMDHTRGQADAIRMLKAFLAKARGE